MLFYSIYRFLLDLNEARHSKDTISTTDGATLRNRGETGTWGKKSRTFINSQFVKLHDASDGI